MGLPTVTDRDEYFDASTVKKLEELYERTELGNRTHFAKFLGVHYVTYCNYRRGRNRIPEPVKQLVKQYLKMSDKELKWVISERMKANVK